MKPLSDLIQEVQQLLEAIARHPNTTTDASNVLSDLDDPLDQLEELIKVRKITLCTQVARVVLDHLRRQGFTDTEFLDGLNGYFLELGLDEVAAHCHEAAVTLQNAKNKLTNQ
jgi:hypothetical protein